MASSVPISHHTGEPESVYIVKPTVEKSILRRYLEKEKTSDVINKDIMDLGNMEQINLTLEEKEWLRNFLSCMTKNDEKEYKECSIKLKKLDVKYYRQVLVMRFIAKRLVHNITNALCEHMLNLEMQKLFHNRNKILNDIEEWITNIEQRNTSE